MKPVIRTCLVTDLTAVIDGQGGARRRERPYARSVQYWPSRIRRTYPRRWDKPILEGARGLPLAGLRAGKTVLCGHDGCDQAIGFINGLKSYEWPRDPLERTCYIDDSYSRDQDNVWKYRPYSPPGHLPPDPDDLYTPMDDPMGDAPLDLGQPEDGGDGPHPLSLPAVVECEKCHGRSVLDADVLGIFNPFYRNY